MKIYDYDTDLVRWSTRDGPVTGPNIIVDYRTMEYEPGEEVEWLAWHSVLYDFDRVVDASIDLDMISITPAASTKAWVSNTPIAFIMTMDNASALFDIPACESGRRYFIRPGRPRPARLFRIPFYAQRVTWGSR